MEIEDYTGKCFFMMPDKGESTFCEGFDEHLNGQASLEDLRYGVDLTYQADLNSSQVARLLRIRKACLKGKVDLGIISANTSVWGTFLVTGLEKCFKFYEDRGAFVRREGL